MQSFNNVGVVDFELNQYTMTIKVNLYLLKTYE